MRTALFARDRYLLVLGATMALRERGIVAALRVFPGPLVTFSATAQTRAGKFFDHVLRAVPSDPAAALAAVQQFEAETGAVPAAVVPFVDGLLVSGWTIADHYGVPYLSRSAVDDSSINKNLMKDRFAAAGVATPRYRQVADERELLAAVDEFGLPCVIKPSAFGGSLGVRSIRSREEAVEAYRYVAGIIAQNAATFSVRNRSVQVEEFCPLRDEVSVEVLVHGGRPQVLAVVDKAVGPAPYFAELGHRVPSRYWDRDDVRDLAARSCTAIGLDRGLAHVEIRVEPDREPQLIEVGARTAGDGILDLVERVLGIAPYELHVRSYLDDLPAEPLPVPEPHGVAAIAFLKAPGGRITELRTPSAVDPAVVGYELSAVPGQVSAADSANYLTREGYLECHWPGADPADVPEGAHLELAAELSRQVFAVEEDVTGG